jgi:hypothetical protein
MPASVGSLILTHDRGHSLTIDTGWPAVAELALTWLRKQGL